MSLTSLIKRIQDIMRQDQGVDGDVQRLMQLVWLIFLKVFDYKEEDNELNDDYKPVIPVGYRWRDWANPYTDDGKPDVKNQLTGQDLITFIDTKLLPVLRGDAIEIDGTNTVIFESVRKEALLVKEVMKDATNLMKNGYLLRQVINILNEIDLAETEDSHEFSEMYESLLDGLQAMGKYGEFHTPRAITRFAIDKIHPKLGETVADWAAGTGGFLVDAIESLKKQVREYHNEDFYQLQKTLRGGEFKPMPFRLCVTNLLLHDIDLPNIRYGDSLSEKNFSEYYGDDLVDVACLNPPYGGIATDTDKLCFPSEFRSSETADLFLALTIKRLKKNGRAIMIVPDGFLFGIDNAKINIKKYLLDECNLHTVIRLPQSCFAPYTSITTNLLFFDKTGPTQETWFYRLDMPEGYKHFSKTKPIKREHFAPVDEWWNNRGEIIEDGFEKSQKYTVQQLTEEFGYNFDRCGYPHEEEEILDPLDLIQRYEEKRASLNSDIDSILNEIKEALKGGTE